MVDAFGTLGTSGLLDFLIYIRNTTSSTSKKYQKMKYQGIRTPKDIRAVVRKGRPYIVTLSIALAAISMVIAVVYIFLPVHLTYAWDGNNCVSKPTILPNLQIVSSNNINVTQTSLVKLLGYPVVSGKTCFEITTLTANGNHLKVKKSLPLTVLPLIYYLEQDSLPTVLTRTVLSDPVPVNGEIQLLLDKPDTHFSYVLRINEAESDCNQTGIRLLCNIENQKLEHASQYNATLLRELHSQQEVATTLSFTTVEPVRITNQSIASGERLLTKPAELVIATDKLLLEASGIVLKSGDTTYKVQYTIEGTNLKIALPPDLPRAASYELVVTSIKGTRSESIPEPLHTSFYLVPGPNITGMSIGDRAVPQAATIAINFDQKISTSSTISAVLKQEGTLVDANVLVNGTALKIIPKQPLSRCAAIQIEISGVAVNNYGVSNAIKWIGASRVTCAAPFSIGTSVEGRGIIGYSFGSGSREILYLGTIHGDEGNSKQLLEKWMYELEGNPGRIPNGTKVVVIPLLNPDGYARGSRYNARSVDLNRNFAANNWKSDIVVQGGATVIKGGGESPVSEPESSAIAKYITNNHPAIIASYHSKGSIVESNEAGAANQLGRAYAASSGYGYKEASSNVGFFNYDVNGSLEEWAKDKLDQPVILIELKSKTSNEFSRNKNAMWSLM